jgi:DNA-binding XRE family transcriptional regulator
MKKGGTDVPPEFFLLAEGVCHTLRLCDFFGSAWKQSCEKMSPFGSIFVGDNVEIRRMRDLREDSDQTQQRIADVLNMHRSVYRRYESGERETPAWVVVKLADYYKVSTDYLLGRTDERVPYPSSRRK